MKSIQKIGGLIFVLLCLSLFLSCAKNSGATTSQLVMIQKSPIALTSIVGVPTGFNVEIFNSGSQPPSNLNFSTPSGPFSIVTHYCRVDPIFPGFHCTLFVQFLPTSVGTFTDTISISYTNNGGSTLNSTLEVGLSGVATAS